MSAIKSLENISGIISHDKASILLVHGKLKPSAMIVMEGDSFHDLESPVHAAPKHLNAMDAILSELSLSYVKTTEIMETRQKGQYVEVMRFFIARDLSTAKKLKLYFDNVPTNHIAIGLLLGYPETAVNAFLTPNMLDQTNIPKSTEEVSTLNMRLLGHRLSKNNWKEEVKYLEQWGGYIKSISPLIYDETTREE